MNCTALYEPLTRTIYLADETEVRVPRAIANRNELRDDTLLLTLWARKEGYLGDNEAVGQFDLSAA